MTLTSFDNIWHPKYLQQRMDLDFSSSIQNILGDLDPIYLGDTEYQMQIAFLKEN